MSEKPHSSDSDFFKRLFSVKKCQFNFQRETKLRCVTDGWGKTKSNYFGVTGNKKCGGNIIIDQSIIEH